MVYAEEEVDDPGMERSKFYLVGSLWSNRPFSNSAVINMMKTLWRPVEGMACKIIGDDKFLFIIFYCRADVDSVLERRPWT